MHIPDGYLSPYFAISMSAITVPGWAFAIRRVQKELSQKTLPLISFFSALSFVIMLFHLPIPGGTTAHAVGGTFIALVVGPWAAILAISTALILQALFFGDGGILALFTNAFNLSMLLPLVGYSIYSILTRNTTLQAKWRVWAAGIAAYSGLAFAALMTGIELGIQPLLFHDSRAALYIPYHLNQTIPVMLLSHLFGAGFVEAALTGLGVAYLQHSHPEYLRGFSVSQRRPKESVRQKYPEEIFTSVEHTREEKESLRGGNRYFS